MSYQLVSTSLEEKQIAVDETLFSQGNGYLGVRANFDEGCPSQVTSIRGAFINAFYADVDIPYGEKLHGFPDDAQKLVNLPDAQQLTILVGVYKTPFSLFEGEVIGFERRLDMLKGTVVRDITWRAPTGETLKLTFTRIVAFEQPELFATQIEVASADGKPIPVILRSTLQADVENYTEAGDPRLAQGHSKLLKATHVTAGKISQVSATAFGSGHHVAVTQRWQTPEQVSVSTKVVDESAITEMSATLDTPLVVTRWNWYTDSRRHQNPLAAGEHLATECDISEQGFDALKHQQAAYLDRFWSGSDLQIEGDEEMQLGIRFNLYQLLQSVGRDKVSNIAAKGLSGEGYEGHYFWDTEIYVLPVLTLTQPELAKNLLLFRYHSLDGAKARAKEMGHRQGALFPWRTIKGSECSSFFPAGTAQYHISADVAYSYIQYYLATNDRQFMVDYGAEVLFETARLWVDAGHLDEDGLYRLDCVTGPDEYTALVNNNYFTNAMVQHNLRWAVRVFGELNQAEREAVMERIGLSELEVESWRESMNAYLPMDEQSGVCAQDDSFLDKAVWDFADTPDSHYPLLLNYHPMTLYRYQVCKQPDTVLAHYLLDEIADTETMRRTYEYYESITTHDSSLSSCVFSIMAARIGDLDKAERYFSETARLDLDNTHGNTKDGLHIANLAGTWQGIVCGFGGVRVREDGLRLQPSLPSGMQGYRFKVHYQGSHIEVTVSSQTTVVSLLSGNPVTLIIGEETVELVDEVTLHTVK